MASRFVRVLRNNLKQHAFRWEIILVLAIKLCAIMLIKIYFFSEPVDIQLPDHRIEKQMGLLTHSEY